MLSNSPDPHRYAIEMAYLGTPFHGWQIQPNAITVQEVLNQGLSLLLGSSVQVVGAGRTDTGVHASHFVAHFDTELAVPDLAQLAFRLNSFVKQAIRIDRIVPVSEAFHSRFSAIQRTYRYIISQQKDPFLEPYAWLLHRNLDVKAMQDASQFLMGERDFSSFARQHSDTKSQVCTVNKAMWEIYDGRLLFTISANRFLRNMVRAIVGTMVDIGLGKLPPDSLLDILRQAKRSAAGQSAPPQGLFLSRIDYPPALFEVHPRPVFPLMI